MIRYFMYGKGESVPRRIIKLAPMGYSPSQLEKSYYENTKKPVTLDFTHYPLKHFPDFLLTPWLPI